MELTVLGKYGPYPKNGSSACSGYLVSQGNTKLLLDCGAGVLGRLRDLVDITTLSGIYISHLHYDHTSDLLSFRYLLEDLRYTITLFIRKDDSPWYKLLTEHPNINVVNVDENSCVKCGEFELTFVELVHPVPDLGIRVRGEKTLFYTGDTTYCENVITAARNTDYMLADCSKPIGFMGPHMTADKAIEIQRLTGVKLFATHLSPDFEPTALFADCPKIAVVEELKTYKL